MELPAYPFLDVAPPDLPDSLLAEIELSVWLFEQQFPLFMRNLLHSGGYLDKYREEITRLIRLAYNASERERAQAEPANERPEERQQQNGI
jgi:hypothetical protein